jgi:capping protein beta
MDAASKVDAALNILQRTPPEDTEENVNACAILLSNNGDGGDGDGDGGDSAVEELYQRIDCPLKDAIDKSVTAPNGSKGRSYILSDHNRDGDCYRSPWSNEYYGGEGEASASASASSSSSAFKPSRQLRQLEEMANEVFDSYRKLYYGNSSSSSIGSISSDGKGDGDISVSSVYLWNKEGGSLKEGFAGCFLIKKTLGEISSDDGTRSQSGYWNSIHVVDVNCLSGGKAKYELSTTVLLSLDIDCHDDDNSNNNKSQGKIKGEGKGNKLNSKLGGSLTKQIEKIQPCPNESSHIANIGKIIEEVEIELRSNMDALYIQKTREVLNSIRCDSNKHKHRMQMKEGLMAAMKGQSGHGRSAGIQSEMSAVLGARKK